MDTSGSTSVPTATAGADEEGFVNGLHLERIVARSMSKPQGDP